MIRRIGAGAVAALLVGASGALAQDTGACGQAAALTQGLREPLRQGFDQRSVTLDIRRSEARYVDFTLEGDQPLYLRTDNSVADPLLALFDQTGALIGHDDDSAGDLNSLLRFDLAAGTYCAQVRLHGAEPADASVGLILSSDGAGFPAGPPPEPGMGPMPCDTAALLDDLGVLTAGRLPASLSGRVAADVGQVAWRFTLEADTPLLIDAVSNDIDTVLSLYDASGALAYENDDHPEATGSNSRLAEALPAGNWCLAVAPYDYTTSGNVLVVAAAPPADMALGGGAVTGGFDSGADMAGCGDLSALPVLAEGLTAGFSPWIWDWNVAENGRADFRLSLSEPLDVQLDAGSPALDTVMTVFDAGGGFLFENDDHPDVMGSGSRLVERLEAGDYCVSVRGFAGAGGDFALSVALPGQGQDLSGGGSASAGTVAACAGPNTGTLAFGLTAGFAPVSLGAEVTADGPADLLLSLSEPLEVQLDAASPVIDTVLELYSLDGTYITENDDDFDAGGTNSRIVTVLDPGDYCVRTRGFADATGPVTVAVALPGAGAPVPEAPELVLPATFEELGTLTDQPLKSLGLTQDQVLWAAFELDAEGMVDVQGVSLGAPFTLTLMDASGNELVAQPSEGDVANTTITSSLAPGRYLVALANAYDLGELKLRQITVVRSGS
ncbi:MAG: DVUA0089 family protein [Rhodobacteraceae bacterium]|nr:DVUA0089 family protein [Paracoccaceae bacterium]